LAAVQRSNCKLMQKETELQELKEENHALANQLNELQPLVKELMETR
jgi:hypothetical protein